MLEGIRGLAENHPVSRTRDLVQLSSWAATFVLFVASGTLVLLGSRSWRRLLGFAAAGVAFQIVTLVQPAPVLSALLVLGVAWIIWPVGRGPARRAGRVLEVTS